MKTLFLSIVLLFINGIFCQTNKITSLFQKTLQLEIEARKGVIKDTSDLERSPERLIVTEPFTIKKDTLYYTVQKRIDSNRYHVEQQKMALKDVKQVTKDIGLFLETHAEKVIKTRQEFIDSKKVEESIFYSDTFETYMINLSSVDYFADEMIEAFRTSGFKITKGYWYD